MRRYRGRRARAGLKGKAVADGRPAPSDRTPQPALISFCQRLQHTRRRASKYFTSSFSFLRSDMAPLAPAASESTPLLRPSSPSPSWLSATRQGEHEDSAIDIRIRRDISELAGGHESEDEEDFIGRSSFGQAVSLSSPVRRWTGLPCLPPPALQSSFPPRSRAESPSRRSLSACQLARRPHRNRSFGIVRIPSPVFAYSMHVRTLADPDHRSSSADHWPSLTAVGSLDLS